jgi:hypothetical protein
MTCNELQDSVKNSSARADRTPSIDIRSHLESCSACRQWIEINERLAGPLQILRSAMPSVPATLDESVREACHAHFQHPADVIPSNKPVRPISPLFWRAAIAALLIAGAIILFGTRRAPSPPTTAKIQRHIISSTQVQTPTQSEAPKPDITKPALTKKRPTSRVHHRAPAAPDENSSTETAYMGLPPDFRNLMYCDQLSCSGALEVIRMNLPASSLGMASPLRTSNVVAADVLVGADGVARAIRIVN